MIYDKRGLVLSNPLDTILLLRRAPLTFTSPPLAARDFLNRNLSKLLIYLLLVLQKSLDQSKGGREGGQKGEGEEGAPARGR